MKTDLPLAKTVLKDSSLNKMPVRSVIEQMAQSFYESTRWDRVGDKYLLYKDCFKEEREDETNLTFKNSSFLKWEDAEDSVLYAYKAYKQLIGVMEPAYVDVMKTDDVEQPSEADMETFMNQYLG